MGRRERERESEKSNQNEKRGITETFNIVEVSLIVFKWMRERERESDCTRVIDGWRWR